MDVEEFRIPKLKTVLDCLRKVPQYAFIENILLCEVAVDSIVPLARYVVKDRLTMAMKLANAMKDAEIKLYKPVMLRESENEWRLIMPPVIEKHNDKWILFDGLHRLWLAKQMGIKCPWVLCIEAPPLPLPSLPRDWDQIIITENRHPLSENLAIIDESLIRPISKIFKSSAAVLNIDDAEI